MNHFYSCSQHGRHQDFRVRGQRGGKAECMGAEENCCYRIFNWGKLAAGALAVNDQKYKEIQHWLWSVLTHFIDFYIKFTLRQWMGRVERAHIIFFSRRLAEQSGEERRAQGGSCPLSTPLAPPVFHSYMLQSMNILNCVVWFCCFITVVVL